MRFFLSLLPLILFCFAGHADAADDSASREEDLKALTILARNCAGCHQEADHPGALFLNQARLTEPQTIALIRKLVETSQMPPQHAAFKKSRDGRLLLKWLNKREREEKGKTR